jgi:hypothetical protein
LAGSDETWQFDDRLFWFSSEILGLVNYNIGTAATTIIMVYSKQINSVQVSNTLKVTSITKASYTIFNWKFALELKFLQWMTHDWIDRHTFEKGC